MYSEFIRDQFTKKTRSIRTHPELHLKYRGPLSDSGTSNAPKSPLTTELDSLGAIFGIRRQNSIRITLYLKEKIFSKNYYD